MSYTVSVDLHRPQIAALFVSRARRLGNNVQRGAQRRAPKRSGRLAASLYVRILLMPGVVVAVVGTPLAYGEYQHEGTGIYGPRGRPIRAKSGGVMRFVPGRPRGPVTGSGNFQSLGARARSRRRSGGLAYAREVKGVPGQPYLVDALYAAVGPVSRIRRFRSR